MTKRRVRPTSDFLIKDLYTAVKSWMEYHFEINQQYVLSEDSIKIPICDYLSQYPGDVELEKKIDYFKNRHYDLYFRIKQINNESSEQKGGIEQTNGECTEQEEIRQQNDVVNENKDKAVECEYFFEFKYVHKEYTRTAKEIERYFADIARLKAKADAANTECYLLVCGSKKDFINEFMGKTETTSGFNPFNGRSEILDDQEVDEEIDDNATEKYNKMFAFEENQPKSLDFDDEILKVYKDNFKEEYKLTKDVESKTPSFYDSFFNFKTTCVALLCDEKDSYSTALGLWKIESSEITE
jgi:hypothetical protein